MFYEEGFVLPDHPRLLLIGRSGTGKEHFANRLSKEFGWNHINVDKENKYRNINVKSIIPQEDFTIVNWTIIPSDLPHLANIVVRKEYSILKFLGSEEDINSNLERNNFSKEFIEDENRINNESRAVQSVDILCSLAVVMNSTYFDDFGKYKQKTFLEELDSYYRLR